MLHKISMLLPHTLQELEEGESRVWSDVVWSGGKMEVSKKNLNEEPEARVPRERWET